MKIWDIYLPIYEIKYINNFIQVLTLEMFLLNL